MAKPWRHPETQVYYLRRQVPADVRPAIGRALWKASLHTRDPKEAARLFLAANAELEQRFAAARAAAAAQAAQDEISAEAAGRAVASFLSATAGPKEKRWPSLGLTWWLEDTADIMFGSGAPGGLPVLGEDGQLDPVAMEDAPTVGEGWLAIVRELPASKWLPGCRIVLDPLFETARPAMVRTASNEAALMAAWNMQVMVDLTRLRGELEEPRSRQASPRLRPNVRLRELVAEWNKAQQPKPQTFFEVEAATLDFIDWFGDVPIGTITSDMLFDYRDAAKGLPKSMPRAHRLLPFRERLARHIGTKAERISPATLKKRLGAIQALLSFAHQERWIANNVGVGIKINGYSRAVKARRSFRDGELSTLFAGPLFTKPDSWHERQATVSRVTLYWVFLLGLTSGARLEEVGQARLADVKADAGVLFIDVDERETAGAAAADTGEKSLKNEGSRRVLPIHARLLQLGFEPYRDALGRLGHEMLFPDLRASVFGKVTKEASRIANRYINKHVADDPRLVFHSLRHKFKDEGRAAGVQDSVLDQITGHSPATEGARYGEGVALAFLKAALDRLAFAAVDWNGLVTAAAKIDWMMSPPRPSASARSNRLRNAPRVFGHRWRGRNGLGRQPLDRGSVALGCA